MNGVSKAYAMTGWRIGYAAGPAPLIKAMDMVQGQQTSGACTIAQWAAVEALNGPQDFIPKCRKAFEERRDLVVSMLGQAQYLQVPEAGGRVLRLSLLRRGDRQEDAVGQTNRQRRGFRHRTAGEPRASPSVHGSAFGQGPNFRVSYAASLQDARGSLPQDPALHGVAAVRGVRRNGRNRSSSSGRARWARRCCSGWLAAGLEPARVDIIEPAPSPAISGARGAARDPAQSAARRALAAPEVLFLAIKPQTLEAAAPDLAPLAGADTLVMSILAGKRIADLDGAPAEGARACARHAEHARRGRPRRLGGLRQPGDQRAPARNGRKA